MVKPIPVKNNSFGLTAKITLPIIIKIPPQKSDFLNPRILSANNPPINVKAYTQAWVAPYCKLAVVSSMFSWLTIKTASIPRIP